MRNGTEQREIASRFSENTDWEIAVEAASSGLAVGQVGPPSLTLYCLPRSDFAIVLTTRHGEQFAFRCSKAASLYLELIPRIDHCNQKTLTDLALLTSSVLRWRDKAPKTPRDPRLRKSIPKVNSGNPVKFRDK